MEKQKMNVSTLVIVIAIVLIMGVIAGVLIGKNMSQVQTSKKGEEEKIQQENKVIKNETTQTNIQDNKGYASSKQEARKELDINSEQIKKLYNYIPAINMGKIEKNAYQTAKTTKKDIPTDYLLAKAFRNIKIEEKDKEFLKGEDGTITSDWYQFDSGLLQEKIKEMYGENIENKSFDFGCAEGCNYNNGKYTYGYGGATTESQTNIRGMIKAYEQNEEIYIEDNYIYVKSKEIFENGSDTGKQQVGLYPSSNSEKELEGKYNTTEMPKYRHTFKKNEEGNYYWYSTEPIK